MAMKRTTATLASEPIDLRTIPDAQLRSAIEILVYGAEVVPFLLLNGSEEIVTSFEEIHDTYITAVAKKHSIKFKDSIMYRLQLTQPIIGPFSIPNHEPDDFVYCRLDIFVEHKKIMIPEPIFCCVVFLNQSTGKFTQLFQSTSISKSLKAV